MWRVTAEEWISGKVVGTKDFKTEEEALDYALNKQEGKFAEDYFTFLTEVT